MKYKIFLVFIILVFSLNSVHAENNISGDLQVLMDSSDNLNLEKNYIYANNDNLISISNAMNENNCTINGQNFTIYESKLLILNDVNFTMSVDDIYYGEDLIINFNITQNATGIGELSIWYNDTYYKRNTSYDYSSPSYSSPFNLDDKIINVPYLNVGSHLLFLEYIGDDYYKSKIINQTFNVYPADYNRTGLKTKLIVDDLEKYYKSNGRLNISLVDENNNPLTNKVISIKINGVSYDRITDNQGQVSLAINLNSGDYNAIVTFKGDDIYASSTTISSVYVKSSMYVSGDMKIYCRNGGKYSVQCMDTDGNLLTTGEVEFNVNGVIYHRSILDDNFASLNINLNPGNYTITAKNLVTGEMQSSLIQILPTITQNYDLVKYYKNDSQFCVYLVGIWPFENKLVTFNINGVFYERYTDENGTAKLNINLEPGEYIITSDFNGCMVSNIITVLPVLNASDLKMVYKDGSQFEVQLVDGNGSPLANTNIIFNINGVFYTRTTDESGIARLNINLMKGEYIITSSYNGCNIANTITIV